MKTLLLTLAGLILSVFVSAQEYKKEWKEGRLSWEDFSERENATFASYLQYDIFYKPERSKFGDTTIYRIVAYCTMDRQLSWVDRDLKSDELLRYNQVIFDIVEKYRRKLEVDLNSLSFNLGAEEMFHRLIGQCRRDISQLETTTNHGRDLTSLPVFEERIAKELQYIIPDPEIPHFNVGKLGYGVHIGLGSGYFTGSLGDHFTPVYDLIFGFDVAWGRITLFLNATLGFDKVKLDYRPDLYWHKGQRTNVAIGEASLGYAVIDNKDFKLAPFAGYGFTEFSHVTFVDKNRTQTDIQMSDGNIIFGVNADYKRKTILTLAPSYFRRGERTVFSFRARLYVAKADYFADLKGYSINFSLGVCGFGNMLKW